MTPPGPEYYSEHGEDYLLNWVFEGTESGFYVDIGAGDGRLFSNTCFFEQLGWSGICVEPDPEQFQVLQRNRPHAVCVNAAVPRLTPAELMETHAPGRRHFEILSINAGGTELELLRAFDLNHFNPAAIVTRANDAARHEIISLLSSRGFHFARRLEGSLVFCRFSDLAVFARHKRIRFRRADTVIEQRGHFVAPNVLRQASGQPLSSLLEWCPEDGGDGAPAPGRIVHAVNLSTARVAEQQATTRSMLDAAKRSRGEVTLLNVQHCAEPDLTPAGFARARDLTRNVTDVKAFEQQRSLPLIFDILDSAVEGVDAGDYVVFTNSDICLREHFYTSIRELIALGFDALTVNRRTIGRMNSFPENSRLPLAETGLGHAGFDCFVFRRGIYDHFAKNLACVGAAGVARGLIYNMVALSTWMLMLRDVSLTYHYGNDRPWMGEGWSDYRKHNTGEYLAVLESLCRDARGRERLTAFCENHAEPQRARRYVRELESGRE